VLTGVVYITVLRTFSQQTRAKSEEHGHPLPLFFLVNEFFAVLHPSPRGVPHKEAGSAVSHIPTQWEKVLVSGIVITPGGESQYDTSMPPISADPVKHFLIVDNRFGTPIHVFLELDPTAEPGFPGFVVRSVTLEPPDGSPGLGVPAGFAIGRNPHQLDRFRVFRSNQAVAGAGFILIEPRYVGPNWSGYVVAFRPGGEKPIKRHGSDHHVSSKL